MTVGNCLFTNHINNGVSMQIFSVFKISMIRKGIKYSGLSVFISCTLLFGQDFTWEILKKENINQKPFVTGNVSAWSQSAISTFKGWQYVTYYVISEQLCAGRRKLPDGKWEHFCFEDYVFSRRLLKPDGHNNTVLGICPNDGTIHLTFDHHAGPLNYRISKKNVALNPEGITWGPELFGPVTSILGDLEVTSVTYPRLFQTPLGALQLVYRSGQSGNGTSHFHEYTADNGWEYIGQFTESQGVWDDPYHGLPSNKRSAYFNRLEYDRTGRLHVSWCWRETSSPNSSQSNRDLMYVYSDDYGRTWRNNAGKQVGETGGTQIGVSTEGVIVWNIPRWRSYINQMTQAVDSEGRIHVVVWFLPPDKPDVEDYKDRNAEYYHFVRLKNGEWKMTPTGFKRDSRPKLLLDKYENAFLVVNQTRILSATARSGWTDWKEFFSDKVSSGDPAVDYSRWEEEGILSLWTHELRATDYKITANPAGLKTQKKSKGLLQVTREKLSIDAGGNHSIAIFNVKNQRVFYRMGYGSGEYKINHLKQGVYLLKVTALGESWIEIVKRY